MGKCRSQNRYPNLAAAQSVVPHDADPAVCAPELIVHSPDNYDGVVNDVALAHRERAADRQEPVGVDAHPVR